MVTPISLGPHCVAAGLLDHLGLRQEAYPFDWLVTSLAVVEHCLADDFATFLDTRHHRWKSKRQSDHAFYLEHFGVEAMFRHHAMPRDIEHFRRAVERFRAADNPVFLYIDVNQAPGEADLARVQRLLRGPLLAYCLLDPGVEVQPRAGVGFVRMRRKWDHEVIREEADQIGFSATLRDDILRSADIEGLRAYL